jgi:hypothetical protein
MKLEAPTTTALIGLLGVLLGSLIHWTIARFGRIHERNLALELRRTDKRIEAYNRLLRYVAECEKEMGRSLGGPILDAKTLDEVQRSKQDDEQASYADLNIDLLMFGSLWLSLILADWHVRYLENVQARVFELAIDKLVQLERLGEDETQGVKELARLTDARARGVTDRLVRQIQAELEGRSSWYIKQRLLKEYIRRRADEKRLLWEETTLKEGMAKYRRIMEEHGAEAEQTEKEASSDSTPAGASTAGS